MADEKKDLVEKVKQIISEQLGVDEGEVAPSASFVDDLGADSLDQVELVMALEEAFGVEIPDEDAEKLRTVQDALDYIEKHASASFRVSDKIRAIALTEHWELPANVAHDREGTHVVFFGDSEGPGPWNWNVNDPWLTEAVFGPREVNFNWYSSWAGYDHIVIMTLEKARATGAPLAQ